MEHGFHSLALDMENEKDDDLLRKVCFYGKYEYWHLLLILNLLQHASRKLKPSPAGIGKNQPQPVNSGTERYIKGSILTNEDNEIRF